MNGEMRMLHNISRENEEIQWENSKDNGMFSSIFNIFSKHFPPPPLRKFLS
jgi:hypothetical protein